MGKLSQLVEIKPCEEEDIAQNIGFERVVILLIAFVERGGGDLNSNEQFFNEFS